MYADISDNFVAKTDELFSHKPSSSKNEMSFNGSYCQNVEAVENESETLSCTGGHVGDGKSIATTKTYVNDDITKDEETVVESRDEDLITSNIVRQLENVDFTETCNDEFLDKTEVAKDKSNST